MAAEQVSNHDDLPKGENTQPPESGQSSYLEALRKVISLANERLEEGQEDKETKAKRVCLLATKKNRIYEIFDSDPSERDPEKRYRPQYAGKLRDALSSGLRITAYELTEDGNHVDRIDTRFWTGRSPDTVNEEHASFLSEKTPLRKMNEVVKDLSEAVSYDQESFDKLIKEFEDHLGSLVDSFFTQRSTSIVRVGRKRRR